MSQLAPDIYVANAPFGGFPFTLYFIRDSEWAVIDTGVAATVPDFIVPFMAEHGGVKELDLALCTHAHVDHVGGNATLKAANPSIRCAVHERDMGWAESITRQFFQLYKSIAPGVFDPGDSGEAGLRAGFDGRTTAVDVVLTEGEPVAVGGRALEVHLAAGHSPGHVVFVDRSADIAFTGDVLQHDGFLDDATGLRTFPLYHSVAAYKHSLGVIRGLGVSTFCTAHQGVLVGAEAQQAIEHSEAWSDRLHELVHDVVRRRRRIGLSELVDAVSERLPGYEHDFQIYATCLSHLNELVRTGDAVGMIAPDETKTWTVKP